MPPRALRPFPFALNVGTDICQISRIYGILDSPRRSRFINRILAPEEVTRNGSRLKWNESASAANGQGQGQSSEIARDTPLWKTAAFMAGRFAAKEAAIKAHSHRTLTFHDVLIERREGKQPGLGSGPPVARIKAGEGVEEDVSALISISHDGDYATAVCIADIGTDSEGTE